MADELQPLPCPFCGEAPEVAMKIEHWFVRCTNEMCPAIAVVVQTPASREAALLLWNMRSNLGLPPTMQTIMDAASNPASIQEVA